MIIFFYHVYRNIIIIHLQFYTVVYVTRRPIMENGVVPWILYFIIIIIKHVTNQIKCH